MVQVTQTARLYDDRFRGLYERHTERKGLGKAVVALAHEILRIAYYMLKRNEPCRGGFVSFNEKA